jgi:hypothetical protein
LESTTYFDAKLGYVGSYFVDGGLSGSPHFTYLCRELSLKLPKILADLRLSQAWFYKYDLAPKQALGQSETKKTKGIGLHSDQATVNMNIWLTPTEYNRDPDGGGGLLVYNAYPPSRNVEVDGVETSTFADFHEWNSIDNEPKMKEFLRSQNATATRVPYKFNRCVLFNSILLHETDSHRFGLSEEMEEKGEEAGAEQQRINFTILFGAKPAANSKGNREGGMRVF